jgi:hypothetical protein
MTYPELVEFAGDERKANCLARHFRDWRTLTEAEMLTSVIGLMCRVKERTDDRSVRILEWAE